MWDTLSQHPARVIWTLLIALATTTSGLGATLFFLYDLSQTVHENKVTLAEVRTDQGAIRRSLDRQEATLDVMVFLHRYTEGTE